MKIIKKTIADGKLALSSLIQIFYEDGNKYDFSSTKFKSTNHISYLLYLGENNKNFFQEYEEIVKLLSESYKIKIYPIFYEDSESFKSFLKLGNIDFEFVYDRENNSILLFSENCNLNEDFSDKLAVYIAYNLIEIISKKKLGNDM